MLTEAEWIDKTLVSWASCNVWCQRAMIAKFLASS
jgi:hypothetical protein